MAALEGHLEWRLLAGAPVLDVRPGREERADREQVACGGRTFGGSGEMATC